MRIISTLILVLLVGCSPSEAPPVEKAPIPIGKVAECLEWKVETKFIGKDTPYQIKICKKWKE